MRLTLADLKSCRYPDGKVALFRASDGKVLGIYSKRTPIELVLEHVDQELAPFMPSNRLISHYVVEHQLANMLIEALARATWRDECRPCRCGASGEQLHIGTWRMGEGASVWCDGCGVGTPSGNFEDGSALSVNLSGENGILADAWPEAIHAWNRWAAGVKVCAVEGCEDPVSAPCGVHCDGCEAGPYEGDCDLSLRRKGWTGSDQDGWVPPGEKSPS